MKLGFIGLGRMGKAMVLRLLEQGVDVVVYNRTAEKTRELVKEYQQMSSRSASGRRSDLYKLEKIASSQAPRNDNIFGQLTATYSLKELVSHLKPPRIIWLMVPHGLPVDEMINQLIGDIPQVTNVSHLGGEIDITPRVQLEAGDIVIDGGNSFYKDSVRRYESLKKKGVNYLDVGTSGGLEGARHGACLMIGGDLSIYNKVRPCFKAAACPGGYAYFGPAGSGHFVKMVHNGVEYGMLQAIGEGFEILEKGPYKLDLHKAAFNWTRGSVVRGWLMELLERALKEDPRLNSIEGVVGGGETGNWTLEVGKELNIDTPVIEKSLEARKKSLEKPTFSGKVVATLRREFGGHPVTILTSRRRLTASRSRRA